MIRLLRYLRWAAFMTVGICLAAGAWALDRALGTGRFVFGLGVGLALGIGGCVAFVVYAQRKARAGVRLRQPPMQSESAASYDWSVVALDGSNFPMEGTKAQILFLNIWSTMCPPCIAELPSIERLQSQVASDGVLFMCLATDGDADRVREFVTAKGWKLPFFVLGNGELPEVFDSDYVPATYVVSPDGLVVYQHTGAALWDHPRVVSFLRGLAMRHGLTQASVPARPS